MLESLRLYLPTFTLGGVLDEINRWWETGRSRFTKLLTKMKLGTPAESILDHVLPIPNSS